VILSLIEGANHGSKEQLLEDENTKLKPIVAQYAHALEIDSLKWALGKKW
jgi:hypothetical protein